ncbi:MAG: DUF1634 domain-containing protein [Deltaproteobacteria bacterium]|nr:DUF1634 domain-containing protein [Deltaproteobacteria bacterium]
MAGFFVKEKAISMILTVAAALSAIFLISGFALDLMRTDIAAVSSAKLINTGLYVLFAAPILRALASAVIYASRRDLLFFLLNLYAVAVIATSYFL